MVIETGAVNSTQALAGVISSTRQPEAKAPPAQQAEPAIGIGETFFSPVIKIDRENQTAILQFRDSETGEITKEYPSESVRVYEESPAREKQPAEAAEKEAVEVQQRAQEDVQAVRPEQGEQPAQDILV